MGGQENLRRRCPVREGAAIREQELGEVSDTVASPKSGRLYEAREGRNSKALLCTRGRWRSASGSWARAIRHGDEPEQPGITLQGHGGQENAMALPLYERALATCEQELGRAIQNGDEPKQPGRAVQGHGRAGESGKALPLLERALATASRRAEAIRHGESLNNLASCTRPWEGRRLEEGAASVREGAGESRAGGASHPIRRRA